MISVVLATHNEEKNIVRCLTSIRSCADEILVVDGESTDDTVKLARENGAKIISTSNKSNFHINKQMAMDAATGDIVLQLDADEVVDDELLQFIVSLKKATPTVAAWRIRRKNYFLTRFLTKGGQYPDPVIRLYQKGKARLPQKNVHEQMEVDGSIETAPGHLLHYPYPSLQMYMKKFVTYTSFESERIATSIHLSKQSAFLYMIVKPCKTFFSLYIRHKGFVDGLPGFIFAYLSALHHPFVYLQLWEKKHKL